ncbi:MAG: DUF4180 domain-containing protein [Clostridiaceae bacterium]|mgnify:FL=1|nr:DUF4180 domain-containing protein [Clostridiaceae bacterium]
MRIVEQNGVIITITDPTDRIDSIEDALDFMASAMFRYDSGAIVFHSDCLHRDFFDLKTRFAGEVLQKFSNYNIRLAIVGDFRRYPGQALKDFIYECNQGQHIFWVDSIEDALNRLAPNTYPIDL